MKQYGIIGYPLGHTMSPTLHNWGFRQHALDADYTAWPISPDDLGPFISTVRTRPISGISVTIPHKRTVMPLLDRLTPRAEAVGAVNTLYWDGDDLCGDNTDVLGVAAPIKGLKTLPSSALILGAGGAAMSALEGFKQAGIPHLAVANRTRSKAEQLAARFKADCVDWAGRMDAEWGLICNTTPLGMAGGHEDATPWDKTRFSPDAIAYDIVYNPLQTRFLKEAAAAGCHTISGLEMFLHQGLAQFRLWTGLDMDETGARSLLLNALNA